jgi:hypothetical protein
MSVDIWIKFRSVQIFFTKTINQGIFISSVADPVPDPDPQDPYVFGPPGSFYNEAKIARKTLIYTVF